MSKEDYLNVIDNLFVETGEDENRDIYQGINPETLIPKDILEAEENVEVPDDEDDKKNGRTFY